MHRSTRYEGEIIDHVQRRRIRDGNVKEVFFERKRHDCARPRECRRHRSEGFGGKGLGGQIHPRHPERARRRGRNRALGQGGLGKWIGGVGHAE
jgi:hypothetical protein